MDPEQLRARRARIESAWGGLRGPVVIPSGLPVPVEGTDQFHDFHAHNEHYYLAGTQLTGSVLAFDPREGWTLFAPVADEDERIWTGDSEPLDAIAGRAALERVRGTAALRGWLEAHRGEPLALLGSTDILHHPAGYAMPSLRTLELEVDGERSSRLAAVIAEARRAKDGDELAKMREAARQSVAGHLLALRTARAGMTERRLQVELEAEFFRHGAARTAYGSIVGTGPNGAVLHFSPTQRELRDGDIVLIDAAGEHEGYAADVTRTFPVGPRFTGIQRDLYELVLATQERAIAKARPGKEYRELHLEAAEQIAAGLVDLGILRGAPQDLVERDAHALFFPHGLGHMLGLATHDAGGCLAGRAPSDRFGLKWLRADLPLQPGYVVTIEPGIYFVRAILEDPARRERYRDDVAWERVDELLDFGGIRIEDDVLITPDGAEVLTAALPKSAAAIEALRQEAQPA
ncbi:MAG: aminopeptidase P family protein [Dehalococcoidia bacterium]|nr:aminopeptidase P family protein [Dehalococcoidia bacterium]